MNIDQTQAVETHCSPTTGHVLIVDDEPHILETFGELLRQEGLLVKTASNAQEALDSLDENVSLMILDWNLRGAGGILDGGNSILKHCRTKYPHLLIIVISGHGKAVEILALLNGADQFFEKPADFTVFLPLVRRWMQRAQVWKQSITPPTADQILPLDEVERRYVSAVVNLLDGNISLAAQKLNLNRHTVRAKVKREEFAEVITQHARVA